MTEHAKDAEAIFLAALDKATPGERAAYVAEACVGNPELLGRVRELLGCHDESRGPLDAPPPGLGGTVDESPLSERPGTQIGPYKLLQQIGEGGMGTVFLAEQQHPVRRQVAVKVIKAGMDSRQVIARFEAERQALAMMDHVNIARVLDAGATDSGRPFFVMELVKGAPITRFCDDNRLAPRQRLELFVSVCQAIQHAHQKGVIHRDIKPSNVLVTLYDGRPVAKVIDFGVAKATEQTLTERTLFTQYGAMVGTLEYMSPEQAEMSALGVDTRSDIYSLGVLLYELLTGSTPLTHKLMKEAPYAEILRMIKEEEPPRPSTRLSDSGETLASISANRHTEPAKLTKQVRGELDWIVMKTLEKDRSRRYEAANDLATDVQRYLNDEQVQACPPSARYRLRKFLRRNKGPVLAGALVLLALVGGIIGTTWGMLRATDAEADAVSETKQKELALKDKETALTAAQRAERERTDQLWRSHRDRARALRVGGQVGQRFESLKALAEAARVACQLEVGDDEILKLRNEAVASLALADMRFERPLLQNVRDKITDNHWIAFDPFFHYFAHSDRQGNVSIRRVADGQETARVPAPEKRPWWVTLLFSPDGRWFGLDYQFAGQTARAQVWAFRDGELGRKTVFKEALWFVFSPDSRLAAVCRPNAISICDVASGREIKRLPQTGTPYYMSFGRQLAVCIASGRHRVLVLDPETGEKVARFEHPEVIDPFVWRNDGRLLAVSCRDQRIYVWDVVNKRLQSVLEGHTNFSLGIQFSHRGDFLISRSFDQTSRLWDPVTGRQLVRTGDDANVHFVALCRDDRKLAVLTRDHLELWEVVPGTECRTLHHGFVGNRTPRPGTGGPFGVDFSPTGRILASAGIDGIRLWDMTAFAEVAHLPVGRVSEVLFHPDGASLLSQRARSNGGPERQRWPIHHESKKGSGGPDSPDLLRVGPPQTVLEPLLHVLPFQGKVLRSRDGLVRSPDGRWAARAWDGPEVRDAATGKPVWRLPSANTFVGFSPDGRWLVSNSSQDRAYCFWQVGSWQAGPVIRYRAPEPAYNYSSNYRFSPDGSVLLRSDLDRVVKLLHPGTANELATLTPPYDKRGGVPSFNPDGSVLAVTTNNHTIHVWDLRVLRRGLAEIGLDWDLPPYPPATPRSDARALRVKVEAAKVPRKEVKEPPPKK